ncbi:hypothetical protein K3495_g6030 [Podosphaera aphanis]|nr:hypothetical protein K3495_g6030 [Podosphaera aphanis]
MASKVCKTCMRAVTTRSHSVSFLRIAPTSRGHLGTRTYAQDTGPNASNSKTSDQAILLRSLKSMPQKKPGFALKSIQKALGGSSSTYSVYGIAEILFKMCAVHAAYKTPHIDTDDEIPTTEDGEEVGVTDGEARWHAEFNLPVTFSTWAQVTMLHMYLFTARIRNSTPENVKLWQQNLQDQFFFAAEDRMAVNHNMHSGSVRSKYLKDLYVQWRGLIAAYDEGLAKGDAVLASAVWRNVFKANEDVDIRHLAQIVSYMRHTLRDLDTLPTLLDLVNFKFGNISAEKSAVMIPSQMLNVPFDKTPTKDLGVEAKA